MKIQLTPELTVNAMTATTPRLKKKFFNQRTSKQQEQSDTYIENENEEVKCAENVHV